MSIERSSFIFSRPPEWLRAAGDGSTDRTEPHVPRFPAGTIPTEVLQGMLSKLQNGASHTVVCDSAQMNIKEIHQEGYDLWLSLHNPRKKNRQEFARSLSFGCDISDPEKSTQNVRKMTIHTATFGVETMSEKPFQGHVEILRALEPVTYAEVFAFLTLFLRQNPGFTPHQAT